VQPLVLRCDLAGQLGALGIPPGYVVLHLQQGVPVGEALLDGAGHAALLLSLIRDAAVVPGAHVVRITIADDPSN
jgi:hypothetical protein